MYSGPQNKDFVYMLQQLRFVKEVNWKEVFAVWRAAEGTDPVWQEFARREKGWDSWEAWRGYQAELFGAGEREWKLYEIVSPGEVVPKFRMGPFQGWQKHFEEKNVDTFENLVREKTDWVAENIGVRSRLEQFPEPTQFIGVYLEDENVIVLYEGHHRAAAITLAAYQGKPIVFHTNPTIALTSVSGDARPFFDRLLEQGSGNPQRSR